MLDMRRVVGMGRVFARVLLMGRVVMGIFVALGSGRCRSSDREIGQIGLGLRRSRLAGLSLVVLMLVVRVVVIMRGLMTLMVMMAEIGGMRFVAVGVKPRLVALNMIVRRMLVIPWLLGVGRVGACCLDDAALHRRGE